MTPAPRHWTILTCEYPPDCGGVGDYTRQVAAGLAATGDTVTVVCPPKAEKTIGTTVVVDGAVAVMTLPDVYGSASRVALDARLGATPDTTPSTLLVQYVPTGFGMRGANIPFCRWLVERAQHDDVRVMFHEPYFEYSLRPLGRNVLALAERLMARLLLQAASRAYTSTDAWHPYLAPYAQRGRKAAFETLPIPSAIPAADPTSDVSLARRRHLLGGSTALIGHFGTYGREIAPLAADVLTRTLMETPSAAAVCVGAGSDAFVRQLVDGVPALTGRVHGTGRTSAAQAAIDLRACDLLIQPYPDGVTTRRTSVMAGLINSRAIATTTGHLTERVWSDTGAVALASASDTATLVTTVRRLLANVEEREALAARGAELYRARFAIEHTVRELQATPGPVA